MQVHHYPAVEAFNAERATNVQPSQLHTMILDAQRLDYHPWRLNNLSHGDTRCYAASRVRFPL